MLRSKLTSEIHSCGIPLAQINGKSLREALDFTKVNHHFGSFLQKEWVLVCPKCDAYALGIESGHPWPFLCSDGVMRTSKDYLEGDVLQKKVFEFACLRFSESALFSGIDLIRREDGTTGDVESLGKKVREDLENARLFEFSQEVCYWGRGHRVWGNLKKADEQTISGLLREWFQIALRTEDYEEAISPSVEIKGLGISFASKHLRMLDPSRYAVLDNVLSEGLGYALNPRGYRLFMHQLISFRDEYFPEENVATIESGIFLLVRQQVRAKGKG